MDGSGHVLLPNSQNDYDNYAVLSDQYDVLHIHISAMNTIWHGANKLNER